MRWGKTYAERNAALMKKREDYIKFAWWPLKLRSGNMVWLEYVWASFDSYFHRSGRGKWVYTEIAL